MFEMKELILISGATSGLGLEFANLCLGNSKGISIIGRHLKALLPEELQIYCNHLIELDLSEQGFLSKQFETNIKNNYGKVVLILNAAAIEPLSRIDSMNLTEFRKCFQVNFFSNVEMICSLIQVIDLRSTELHIVFISTGAIDKQIEGWSAYSISKASMAKFLAHLSKELPRIRVTSFEPGVFSSKIQDKIRFAEDKSTKSRNHVHASEPAKRLFTLVSDLLA